MGATATLVVAINPPKNFQPFLKITKPNDPFTSAGIP
jgi:hypothetical protein